MYPPRAKVEVLALEQPEVWLPGHIAAIDHNDAYVYCVELDDTVPADLADYYRFNYWKAADVRLRAA